MKNLTFKSTIILFSLVLFSFTKDEITDFLKVGNELIFNNAKYILKWSSNPNDQHYKQEYLKQGEELPSYKNMILIEAVKSNLSTNEAVKLKITELDKRKKWDFVANYQVLENDKKPNEIIIDFVVSDTLTTYEWNLYRYQKQNNNMILFAYSYKDSLNDDEDLKKFFNHIKSNRAKMVNKLQEQQIPNINIK
jgi:hypothetical protein